jgi:hypothetical protein
MGIDTADERRTGGLAPAGRSLYGYRVRGRERSAVVLWIGGRGDEPDRVLTVPEAGRRYVPVFVTVRQARLYARRRGQEPAGTEVNTLDLGRVQHWLADPERRRAPLGAVLEAWNFFEDLTRGLDAVDRLPRQGALHNSAYEKLFGAACEGAAWTPDEQRAVLELIRAGVQLWNSCPALANPRS